MVNWTRIDFSDLSGAYGVAGYGLLDALGVRIGQVTGWVTYPSGEIALLKVTVRDWFKSRDFLLPLGAISLIDDARRHVQLRQLTRRTLARQCLPVEPTALPPDDVLAEFVQYFPNPRPSVVERLGDPNPAPSVPQPGRLTVLPDQGDGHGAVAEPTLDPNPHWVKLGRLVPPVWTPLSKFLRSR